MLCVERGGEGEVAKQLAEGEATHRAVGGGEATILEHRCAEQVGGHQRHDHPRVGQCLVEPVDLLLALGVGRAELEEIVIVEGQAVGTELGQPGDRFNDVEMGTRGCAERVASVVRDGPATDGERVVASGRSRQAMYIGVGGSFGDRLGAVGRLVL